MVPLSLYVFAGMLAAGAAYPNLSSVGRVIVFLFFPLHVLVRWAVTFGYRNW